MQKPNEYVEVFMSLIKWFLIVLIVNNFIWAAVYIVGTSESTSTQLNQDGTNNIQEMSNGKTIN